jgi:hypothetical protein
MNRTNIERTIWQDFFEAKLSKGQERKIQVVETAIEIIAKEGPDSMTYDHLAEKCGVTRQLIIHHFPDRTDLLRWGARFTRAHMQNFAVTRMKAQLTTKGQLRAYIQSTFEWCELNPKYASFWLYYFYQCSNKKEFKKQNSEFVEMGHTRIEALLQQGFKEKAFHCPNTYGTAKIIQNIITGSLVSYATENYGEVRLQLEAWTLESIEKLLGADSI